MNHQTYYNQTSVVIIAIISALLALGLVMVLSAGATLDHSASGGGLFHATALRQGAYALAGFVVMLVVSRWGISFCRWRRTGVSQPVVWLILLCMLCLVLVLIPGIGAERNGARRWLRFGSAEIELGFQPSELAKLGVVVFLAAWMSAPARDIRKFLRGLCPAAAVLGVCAVLIAKEDFGTSALVAAVGGLMLLVGGARIGHLILLSLPGIAGFVYLVRSKPYILERLATFRDIWADPQNSGYQAVQSLLTIASGGWCGKGLGSGIQKYGYLPESSTDFIFAIICEELGIVGGLLVIGLFAALVWQGWCVTRLSTDPLYRLLAFGATAVFGLQAVMNMAVVTVLMPTKGIALPLVSAGGSGMIVLGALSGILVGAAARAETGVSPFSVGDELDGQPVAG